MNGVPVVVLFGSNIVVKNRIRRLLSDREITIYEANNRWDLLKIMAENNDQVDLIITNIEIDTDSSLGGISFLKLVKSKSDTIPVFVLTSTSTKEIISMYLREGAAEYILKPFKDSYLKEKILKHLNTESLTEFTSLKFSLKNFINSEIYKAKKGSYSFSLLKISFQFNADSESIELSNEVYKYSKAFYKVIKSIFWDSDLYIQYGYRSHMGFFPFCSQEKSQVIHDKISAEFEKFKLMEPEMKNYSIAQTYSIYPTDGDSVNQLLMALESRTEKIM